MARPQVTQPLPVLEDDQGTFPGRPPVTILIPAHNEAATIVDTVSACLAQTYAPERVIVIDDNSDDGTGRLARDAGATVIRSEAGQKARAQNAGLRAVTTDYVVSIDADTRIAPDCVERLMERVVAGGLDAACGAVIPKPEQRRSLTIRARDFEYALSRVWLRRSQAAVGRMFTLSGAVLCLRTEALRALSGFPETGTGEDAELTWVCYEAKLKVGFAPAAVAYTEEPETLRVYVKQMRRWASDSYQVIARHKTHLSRPACALVVGVLLWDTLVTSGAQLALAVTLMTHGVAWAGVTLLAINFAIFAASFTVAVTQLGWAAAVKSVPARMVVSTVTRWVYVEAFIREWVLGRRLVSWTGRQGNKAVLTAMPVVRRRVFTGGAAVVALWVALVMGTTAGVMEAAGVIPPPRLPAHGGAVPAPGDDDRGATPEGTAPAEPASAGETAGAQADPESAGRRPADTTTDGNDTETSPPKPPAQRGGTSPSDTPVTPVGRPSAPVPPEGTPSATPTGAPGGTPSTSVSPVAAPTGQG